MNDSTKTAATMALKLAMRQQTIMDAVLDAQTVASAVGAYYQNMVQQGVERDVALACALNYQIISLYGDNATAIMRRLFGDNKE